MRVGCRHAPYVIAVVEDDLAVPEKTSEINTDVTVLLSETLSASRVQKQENKSFLNVSEQRENTPGQKERQLKGVESRSH